MDENKRKYLELLEQKRASVEKMLTLTQETQFTGAEDLLEQETESFISLYEQRQNVVERIQKIDKALASPDYENLPDDTHEDFVAVRKQRIEQIKALAATLIELDKKNQVVSAKFTRFVKDNLKQIRKGRDVSHRYVDAHEATSGHLFDSQH